MVDAVHIMDRAAWHGASKLGNPQNNTPIPFPYRAPERNPVENFCSYMRTNCHSNAAVSTPEQIYTNLPER